MAPVVGQIVHKDGKYMLNVAGKTEALPVGLLTDTNFLNEHVGKDVEVIYSVPTSFVVAIKPPAQQKSIFKGPIVICNVPRPDFLAQDSFVTQPSEGVARNITNSFLKQGLITPDVQETILNSYTR